MKTLIEVIKNNIKYRTQIYEMAKGDQKQTYRGSDLGIFWAFAKPLTYTAVFYFAITLGFRASKDIAGIHCPYFVWLMIGIFAWFYMQGIILGGAGCFKKYRVVVRNTTVSLDIIPTVVSLSRLLIHFAIILMILIGVSIFGYGPSIYWLELPIYMALMFTFAVFWSFLTGAVTLVSKDVYNLLQSVSQALFWLSAIIFDINSVDNATIRFIFMFNPITFICEGYRNAVCRHIWIWEEPMKLLCYLIVLAVFVFLSMFLYKKLRRIIPDLV